ncbi:MAG: dephospho-CoA kinase [Bacteroidetes bacterium]|nr:dephospho-CoA kinase [Bacteroidota bacterium]
MEPIKSWRVGITGGIGTGKTTVCQLFEILGIPVYDADYWAKWLIGHDPTLKAGITALLGADAYLPDGSYNRPWVAQQVFSDPAQLQALNHLVHPAVEKHSAAWSQEMTEKGAPYTLKEAALMIESGNHRKMDLLILVTAPEELRIQRVIQRDGITPEQVRARINAQMPEAEKIPFAHFIIQNDGAHSLVKQVWEINQQILQKIFG